jgi:hypothetical protein
MKKQITQVIALVSLLLVWAVLWRLFIRVPPRNVPPPAKPVAAKVAPGDSLLRARFRKVRTEMDALYHYRTKPTPFDTQIDPFRIPPGMELLAESESPGTTLSTKKPPADSGPVGPITPDLAQSVLKSAVANLRFGGVVTLNGAIKVTIDGQLHKEGDVFSTKVPGPKGLLRNLTLRIKHLSAASATIALAEPEAGGAEIRVRLN